MKPLNTGLLKRNFLSTSLFIWLILQSAIPFFFKFGVPHFHYRYMLFSWAMYSKPALEYEVSLFRILESGPEAIPNIEYYVREYVSPKVMRLSDYYRTEEEIQNWHVRLVETIATLERDGRTYGVAIHWLRKFDPAVSSEWKFQIRAERS